MCSTRRSSCGSSSPSTKWIPSSTSEPRLAAAPRVTDITTPASQTRTRGTTTILLAVRPTSDPSPCHPRDVNLAEKRFVFAFFILLLLVFILFSSSSQTSKRYSRSLSPPRKEGPQKRAPASWKSTPDEDAAFRTEVLAAHVPS